MQRNLNRTWWTLAASMAVFGVSLAAQSQPKETFGEVVRVELVNVEVWVTDPDGHPVVGLQPEDFEIREDGERVEIAQFEEIRGDSFDSLVDPAGRDREGAPASPEVGDEPSPIHLVVYFDELRLAPAQTKRVLEDLRIFLATSMVPAERVMIVRQGQALRVEAFFGSTIGEIDDALDRIEGTSTRSSALEKELALQQLQILWEQSQNSMGDPCNQFMRRAGMYVDQYAGEAAARAEVSLRNLYDLTGYLAGLRGVKTLLYVGDSLEATPGREFVAFVEDLCPLTSRGGRGFGIPEFQGEAFFRLTRHANSNRVTIYALQSTGLRPGPLGSASQATTNFRGTSSGRSFESELRQNERQGLDLLAQGTGGRVLANSNRYTDELQAMGHEMSNYYSLAYEPPHAGGNAEHRIEVEVLRPRFQVRHRSGYRAKTADEKMAERLDGAVLLGLQDNPLGARLGAGGVRALKPGTYQLPLHVLVPVEHAVFLPGEDGDWADFAVWAVALDGRNRQAAKVQKRLRARRTPGVESEMVDLALPLDLPTGRYVVGVAVRDEVSQETSYVSTSLEIRAPEDG